MWLRSQKPKGLAHEPEGENSWARVSNHCHEDLDECEATSVGEAAVFLLYEGGQTGPDLDNADEPVSSGLGSAVSSSSASLREA
jgi:hypothetical protein